MSRSRNNSIGVSAGSSLVVACLLIFQVASAAKADGSAAFLYDPISEPIVSATFSGDFAALTAHRTIGEFEVNFAWLLDLCTGLPDLDLSDALFGTSVFPNPADVDMGPQETGIISASIDPSFFPALQCGSVGLAAVFTDTNDALFAVDFLSLTIETAGETIESFYGWPIGDENNGYGLAPPIPDGGDLPAPMPGVLPGTGTGFDEEISSISIYAVPEPASFWLLGVGVVALGQRRRR
ncbi:MAG: PEP-CTERM sorting domain-containing protein [Phycisphaerae bacterium]|nr:PEP-CTERM sorting domain-containing protein [Phycisphaerae bacterium]